MTTWRNLAAAAAAVLALGLAAPGGAAAQPAVTSVAGTPALGLGSIDLKAQGYVVEEFFLAGPATSYKLVGEATADGRWTVEPAEKADYATRIVVVRPVNPKRFNGTVAVEWLNVSAGIDSGPDWTFTHREMLRSGYAYVGVSVQRVGVEGGQAMAPSMPLKKSNPARYGQLSHPGDAFAFDIFSQAGRVAKSRQVMGPLVAKRVLALGESQSAMFLTTYINAIDPLAKVYDGFLVHSRFGSGPLPTAASVLSGPRAQGPNGLKFRPDLRVPVLTLIAETDLIGNALSGFWTARQPDTAKLRTWEMAGTAHADNYVFMVGGADTGQAPIETLARLWKPTDVTIVGKLAKPMNAGPQHHYIAQSALSHLEAWVRTGTAPPKAQPLETTPGAPGAAPTLVVDANGNAKGGIRSPWMDAPTARYSGLGNSGGAFGFLVGVTEPFDAATLARLYPGGKADYLRKFDAALAKAVKAGFILPADQAEARALAAALYPAT